MEHIKKHKDLLIGALVGAVGAFGVTALKNAADSKKSGKKGCCKSAFNKEVITVCLTGAAGQIGYSLIPMICSGAVFGDHKINLRLLDIVAMEEVLKGVVLEIQDGAYEHIVSVEAGSDPRKLFKDLDFGILCGGFPRKVGQERKELLSINGKIFREQGAALNEVANPDVKIVVIANPANTNCLILQSGAPKIPKENFTALTRLDQNRAVFQVAARTNSKIEDVKNVIIWGNHSSTQYPDVNHGTVKGQAIREAVKDDKYLNEDFLVRVQKRGQEVLSARKGSSVFSAANAIKDHIRSWIFGTCPGEYVSMAVYSRGEYNAPKDVIYSFPVTCKAGKWEIVQGLKIDDFSALKMKITGDELVSEKADAFDTTESK